MSMPMPPRGAASSFQLAFQFFCAATEVTHYVPNVGNAVKVQFELIDLAHDLMIAGDLGISIVDKVTRAVVDVHCHNLGLLDQVLELLLDALHDTIEMAAQCGQ